MEGGGSCLTDWVCTPWSVCSNDQQTRTCAKEVVHCYARTLQPALVQTCASLALLSTTPSQDTPLELEATPSGGSSLTGAVIGAPGSSTRTGVLFLILIGALGAAGYGLYYFVKS